MAIPEITTSIIKNPDEEEILPSNIVYTSPSRRGSLRETICLSADKKGEDGRPFCFRCIANPTCLRGKVIMEEHTKSEVLGFDQ